MPGRPRIYNTPAEQQAIRRAQKRRWKRTHREHQREVVNEDESPPSADVLAEAARIRSMSHPTIVGELMGDPLPGRSALDKRR